MVKSATNNYSQLLNTVTSEGFVPTYEAPPEKNNPIVGHREQLEADMYGNTRTYQPPIKKSDY